MKLNICILWRSCKKKKEKQVNRSGRACENSVVAFPLFYLNEKRFNHLQTKQNISEYKLKTFPRPYRVKALHQPGGSHPVREHQQLGGISQSGEGREEQEGNRNLRMNQRKED